MNSASDTQRLEALLADADTRAQFEFEIAERAAIREYDGGEDRQRAERLARAEVIRKWTKDLS